jgi:hypothetical protein
MEPERNDTTYPEIVELLTIGMSTPFVFAGPSRCDAERWRYPCRDRHDLPCLAGNAVSRYKQILEISWWMAGEANGPE